MKRKLSLFVLCLSYVLLTKAQTFHYGVKGDLGFTAGSGNGLSSSYKSGGYQVGGYIEYPLNKKWSIQPEVLFTSMNLNRSTNYSTYYNLNGDPYSHVAIHLNYVTVPVVVNYNINSLFAVHAGAQYSYMVFDDENLVRDGRDAFKKNNVGLVAGGQMNLGLLFLYGRYVYGLSNVNNIDERYKWKTQQFQFGLGFKIK